jgi:probable phosphoglycerate mutase
MRILLLRHGQTSWSLSGQHTGRTDIELTEVGVEEARSVAPVLRRVLEGAEVDAVYASPRKRALRTLELALGPRPAPIVTELLAEFDYGSYEGLTAEQIRKLSPNWDFWTGECPEGETMGQAAARADQFIAELRAHHRGQTVCAASHGHMIRILSTRLLGLEPQQGRLFDIKTASIAEFVEKNESFVVSRWNLTS